MEDFDPLEKRPCARIKKDGTPCKFAAYQGSTVCRKHGAVGRARVAADRRVALAEAVKEMEMFGKPIDVDPSVALLDQIRWSAGHVEYLRAKVQELTEFELFEGRRVDTVKSGDMGGESSIRRESGINMWVQMYDKEREFLAKLCALAIRAGLEERRVRLEEQQGQLVAVTIARILDSMVEQITAGGVEIPDKVWQDTVAVVVPNALRELGS